MKKFITSALLILLFFTYAFFQRRSTTTNNQSTGQLSSDNIIPSQSSLSQSSPSQSSPSAPSQSTSSSSSATTGKFKNGTYTGNAADAYYGNVQVKVVVSGGKISDVQFLDHPQDRSQSVAINNRAMPILKSEAIKAQSANVNTVSGATMTSQAFIQSLQSALSQAV